MRHHLEDGDLAGLPWLTSITVATITSKLRSHSHVPSQSTALSMMVKFGMRPTCLARLFRDCGLYELARIAIGQSRQQLARMGLSDANGHRLDTIELQIRQREFDWRGGNSAELEALIEDAVQNGTAVLGRNDETEPAAAMVGQMINVVGSGAKDSF